MKEEMQEREECWRRKREELRKEIVEIKRKMEGVRMQGERRWEEEEEEKRGRVAKKGGGELEAKIKGLERWRELEEREKRRRNVVVKGVEVRGEGIEGAIRKIWEELGVSARIEEIKEIGRDNGKERKMAGVKMEDKKGKMEVMKKKIALRGGVVRVEDDWTREERAMQWKLEEMAKRERTDNRRAWVRYGRIWMEGRWWRWEEGKERVIDGREERGWRGEDSREERTNPQSLRVTILCILLKLIVMLKTILFYKRFL